MTKKVVSDLIDRMLTLDPEAKGGDSTMDCVAGGPKSDGYIAYAGAGRYYL